MLNVEDQISLKDLSSSDDLKNLSALISGVDEDVQSLATAFADHGLVSSDFANTGTQTEGLTFRELEGLDKSLQGIRGELTNNLAKLNNIDNQIAKEEQKLNDPGADKIAKKDITVHLKNLENERSARLEAASATKDAFPSLINRIKETINKVLREDTTLGERLRTLFRKQGITIISVLTAIGMIIGVIVEAVIPTSSSEPLPPPSNKQGVKEWIKNN